MNNLGLGRCALSVWVSVLLLVGCGGLQPPIGAPAVMQQSAGIAAHAAATTRSIAHRIMPTSPFQVLYSFAGGHDGANPYAGLINVHGTLYGTTTAGGGFGCNSSGCGTAFSITPSGAEQLLYQFGGKKDGSFPYAGLVGVKGTLYGTTDAGGENRCGEFNCGTVFSMTTSGKEKVLYSFGSRSGDGTTPFAALINVNGTLYGTTPGGGAYGNGTVFSITTSGKEKVLYSFGSRSGDGTTPYAALINVNGTLYGTTTGGGAYGNGTIFSTTTPGAEKVLHSFGSRSSDGTSPYAALINVNGTLYGTTAGGGAYGNGT